MLSYSIESKGCYVAIFSIESRVFLQQKQRVMLLFSIESSVMLLSSEENKVFNVVIFISKQSVLCCYLQKKAKCEYVAIVSRK